MFTAFSIAIDIVFGLYIDIPNIFFEVVDIPKNIYVKCKRLPPNVA